MRVYLTFISGALAAVAVAGSVSAAIVPVPGVIDGFGTAITLNGSTSASTAVTTGYSPFASPLGFDERRVSINSSSVNASSVVTGNLSGSGSGWGVTGLAVGGTGNFTGFPQANVEIDYRSTASVRDMTSMVSMSVGYSNNTFGNTPFATAINITVWSGVNQVSAGNFIGSGSGSITVNKADFVSTPAFTSWSTIDRVTLRFAFLAWIGTPTDRTLGSLTLTSFSYVPAPGAIALLGAAGLIGSRRRRC